MVATTAVAACLLGASPGDVDDDYARWDQEQARRAAAVVHPLDEAYQRWEATQAGLADKDLERRRSADEKVREQLLLNTEYARWESAHADWANQELGRKAARAAQAADALAAAKTAEEQAKADLAAAEEAHRAAAEAKAQQAEDDRVAAEQDKAQADDEAARAKQQALDEAKRKQASEEAAIADRYAAQQAADAAALTVTPIAEKTVYATRNVNVRSGPGTDHEVVASMKRGDAVQVNGSANGFYRTTDGRFVTQTYTADDPPAAEAPAPSGGEAGGAGTYAWTSYVANVDSQAAIDQCTGGLTYSPDISGALGKSYYAIHNHCHGMPILSLRNGDLVLIDGVGIFKVVDSRDVSQGDTTAAIRGIGGQILLQTCYTTGSAMRVVGLDQV